MKKDIFNFEGKVVFITGGNGYLGREISLAFCERGAEVIVNSSNKKRNLKVGFNIIFSLSNTIKINSNNHSVFVPIILY